MRKREKKMERYERRSKWSVINTDQNLVDWSRQKEREKERERESSISRVTWNTNIAL